MNDELPDVKQYTTAEGVRVYRIPCQVFPHLIGCVYLVLGLDRPTLIDTGSGSADSDRHLNEGLLTVRDQFGETFSPDDIGRIILTHGHADHTGGAATIVDRTGAELMIHRFDAQAITDYDARAVMTNHLFTRFLKTTGLEIERIDQILDWFGERRGRVRSVPNVTLLSDDDWIGDNDRRGIRIIHTPGHSPGHVCLLIDDLLLAGDHILARTISQQWPESITPHTGLWHYFRSLDRIQQVCDGDGDGDSSVTRILPSHEATITEIPLRIGSIRRNHQKRMDRVVNILNESDGPLNISEIVRRMYVTQQGSHVLLALTDIAARVEYLSQECRVTVANLEEIEQSDTPVYRYRTV